MSGATLVYLTCLHRHSGSRGENTPPAAPAPACVARSLLKRRLQGGLAAPHPQKQVDHQLIEPLIGQVMAGNLLPIELALLELRGLLA